MRNDWIKFFVSLLILTAIKEEFEEMQKKFQVKVVHPNDSTGEIITVDKTNTIADLTRQIVERKIILQFECDLI